MDRIGKFGHGVSYVFRWFLRIFLLTLIGVFVWAYWVERHRPPLSEADQARQALADKLRDQRYQEAKESERQVLENEKYLCRQAAVCKKYDQVRLDCATAGNLKTCLRIKMGENVSFIDICSGYDVGAPAIPLDPKTPDLVRCFFLNNLVNR